MASSAMDEFELIRRYFDRHHDACGVVTGIGDDGAVLTPNSGQEQIQVIDTLVEGVHFPRDTDPSDIAYRAVAVNLSDIAAMGGHPRWMTLALTLPRSERTWMELFAAGLFEAADEFNVVLVGGDTTSGPTLVVTVSMTGEVRKSGALLRSGAQPGDAIYVSGTLGDAAAGLWLLQDGRPDDVLVKRFLRPTARVELGAALAGKATAAIDISDGLAGDLKKLLAASAVGGDIQIERLPLSDALRLAGSKQQQYQWALCGGDDYELCFTAKEAAMGDIAGVTRIGWVTQSAGLSCMLNGDVVEIDDSGYRHFQ
jgi:thiamine-monophosphate kinase